MKQTDVAVSVVVVNSDSELLMSVRKAKRMIGYWQLPGGHLEYAETFEGCAVRELWEETGLRASVEDCVVLGVDQQYYKKENHHYVVVFVQVSSTLGILKDLEPEKQGPWCWVPIGRLPKRTLGPIVRLVEKNKDFRVRRNQGDLNDPS